MKKKILFGLAILTIAAVLTFDINVVKDNNSSSLGLNMAIPQAKADLGPCTWSDYYCSGCCLNTFRVNVHCASYDCAQQPQ